MSREAYTGVRFYAVRTNPRCERRAKLGLEAEGFSVFLPMETHWRPVPARLVTRAQRHNRLRERVERPLLPGYLFVAADLAVQSCAKIRAVHGVESIVGISGTPAPIHPCFIVELKDREENGEFDHTQPPPPTYRPGDHVKVKSGVWSGLVARIITEKGEGRVRVLFEGAFVKGEMELGAEQVERAA